MILKIVLSPEDARAPEVIGSPEIKSDFAFTISSFARELPPDPSEHPSNIRTDRQIVIGKIFFIYFSCFLQPGAFYKQK
jgi:hypothetical protein